MAMATALAAELEKEGAVATIVDATSRSAVRNALPPALPVTHVVDARSVTSDDVSALFLEAAGSHLERWCCVGDGAAAATGRTAADAVKDQLGPDKCRSDAFPAGAAPADVAATLCRAIDGAARRPREHPSAKRPEPASSK